MENLLLSANSYLSGNLDFNRVPSVPLGTQYVGHTKLEQKALWCHHGEKGWYIWPATEYYRYFNWYIPDTHTEHIIITVQLITRKIYTKVITYRSYRTRSRKYSP